MKLLKLLTLLLLVASPALAQEFDDQETPKPRFSGNISDFKTVRFMCKIEGSGERDAVMSNACVVADSATRDGSYDADVEFKSVAGEDPDAFTLLVTATTSGRVPRAVNVRVEASHKYEAAVEQKTSPRNPAVAARGGRLVFWDKSAMIVTNTHLDELDDAVKQSIRIMIGEFFRYYLVAKEQR